MLKEQVHYRTMTAIIICYGGALLGGYLIQQSLLAGVALAILSGTLALWYLPPAEKVASDWVAEHE